MASTQRDLEIEINQQFGVLRANLVADIVRELRANPLGAAEVELDETDVETAGRLARERQAIRDRTNHHQTHPIPPRRGEGMANRGRGGGGDPYDHHDDGGETRSPDGNLGRYRYDREEERFGKLKFTIPKFNGGLDPEAYPTWELKVDKIFWMHNYSEEKKLAMASIEFDDYALIWWEQVINQREVHHERPVASWVEMKHEMRARFMPKHYKRDLYDKLQSMKQGTRFVEEYYQEIEKAMIRANIQEAEEQTMARFMWGLNYPIKRITEFQPYNDMVELVHQAIKAERQLQQDSKHT